ncbi:MAG: UDP-glucose 4-epimerase GalE [Candidatus Doudnabacteria bacterium]|nr:UDP-glucose 4-epimerase GalE [Candidatus Doudnabacteria bacterium]
MDGKPEAVVLSIEKYNEIISNTQLPIPNEASQNKDESTLFYAKTVLVTGGAGYIGAHLARQLINSGHKVVVLDDLSVGKRENVPEAAKFIEGSSGDVNLLRDIFTNEKIDAVMHLAASIEVEESARLPVKYLENNVMNTARLLGALDEAGVKNIIFSSTAAVYGEQENQPIAENATPKPNNPYGYSKYLAEQVVKYYSETRGFNAIVFRYFNACGSDFDGKIKATHESHLLAKLMQVILGKGEELVINGNDYQTHDGTCVRDYVHVLDIAEAHLLALGYLFKESSGAHPNLASTFEGEEQKMKGFKIYNIGTGRGVSVLEITNAAAESLNKMVPMQLGQRRPGDSAESVADNAKIKNELGFEPKFSDLETIVKTAYIQARNHQ